MWLHERRSWRPRQGRSRRRPKCFPAVISSRICRHNATFSKARQYLCALLESNRRERLRLPTDDEDSVHCRSHYRLGVDGHNLHPLAIVTQPTSAAPTPILLLFAGLWARPQPPKRTKTLSIDHEDGPLKSDLDAQAAMKSWRNSYCPAGVREFWNRSQQWFLS